MATSADLEQRVRRLERQIAILANVVVALGDQVNRAATQDEVSWRFREATAEALELKNDMTFERDER
jgi:hypothetical protein